MSGKKKKEDLGVLKKKNERKQNFDVHPDNRFNQRSELKHHAGVWSLHLFATAPLIMLPP